VEHDPYHNPQRAWDEEFGDLLAEGLFHLLHVRARLEVTLGTAFWEQEIAFRNRFIDGIAGQLSAEQYPRGTDPEQVSRALRSLDAARARLGELTPHHLMDFVAAWREDQETWSQLMRSSYPLGSVPAALDRLGLDYLTTAVD
jgi:hypothetical protein